MPQRGQAYFFDLSCPPPLFSFQTTACSDLDFQRRHLERIDLQNFSIKDLNVLITSLSQAIQGALQHIHTTHTVITYQLKGY